MGVGAAADKMHELGEQGESASRALVRGAVSGGIEALTEKIPLDTLADMVKTGGKGVIKNLLKQGRVEATEEGVAYTLNYIADKLAKDPNAKWSWSEFGSSVAGGGLSGLFFGLGGTAVNRVNQTMGAMPGSGLDGTPTAQDGMLPHANQPTAQATPSAAEQTAPAPGTDTSGRFEAVEGEKNAAGMIPTAQLKNSGSANAETAKYTPEEASKIRYEGKSFKNIIAGIDSTVTDFFNKWRSGRKSHLGEKLEKLYLGKMSDSVKQEVSNILGYEVSERDFIVTNDDVKHIMDEHGNAEAEIKKGNLPLGQWVFEAIPDVVTGPDTVTEGHEGTGKNNGKTGVKFEKTLPGGKVVCVQFDNKGRGTMEITTVYAKESTPSMVSTPQRANTRTPEAMESVVLSNTNVPQAAPGVKNQYTQETAPVFVRSAVPFTSSGLSQRMAEAETEYNAAIAQAEYTGEYQLAAALYEEKVRVQEALTEAEIHRLRNELEQYQRQHRGDVAQGNANMGKTPRKGYFSEAIEKSGGSSKIVPDEVVTGHSGTPKKATPGSVVDHRNDDGIVDARAFYGADGLKTKDLHTGNHGNPKRHNYGKNGEHAHDYNWGKDGKLKNKTTREWNNEETERNGDIL